MDPDQTVPKGAVRSGSTLFVKEASIISAYDKSIVLRFFCDTYF